jgi:hypothetical protein
VDEDDIEDEDEKKDVKTQQTFINTEFSNLKESLNAPSVEQSQEILARSILSTSKKSEKLLKLKERIEFHEKNNLSKSERKDLKEDDESQEGEKKKFLKK